MIQKGCADAGRAAAAAAADDVLSTNYKKYVHSKIEHERCSIMFILAILLARSSMFRTEFQDEGTVF